MVPSSSRLRTLSLALCVVAVPAFVLWPGSRGGGAAGGPAVPVVFAAGTLDHCSATLLLAVAATAGAPVHALVVNTTVPRALLDRIGELGVEFIDRSRLELPPYWESFKGYSGGSKPEFFAWLRASGHDRAWFMEDDVLFTGRWRALFASYAHDDADILSYSCDYHPSHSAHWGAGNNCRLPGGRPCVDPALPRNLTKIRWPVMRLSRRLADLVAEKLQAGARGHHEALTGAVCDEDPGCRSGILDDSHRGFVELGHWGRYSGPLSLEQLVNGSVEPGKLYHPVRCRGEPSLPAIAMSYSVSPREGRWRTKDDELNQAVVSAHGVASGSRGYC